MTLPLVSGAMRDASFGISIAVVLVALGCGRHEGNPAARSKQPNAERPSILLVTLDTTRADAVGPEATEVPTPAFNALAARGVRFRQAYATVPETLPSHSSMMTGLYAAGHGVHQNGRILPADRTLVAERLKGAGYRTAAFVSSVVLESRFGLARGFDLYDDQLSEKALERTSAETTDRAIAFLSRETAAPLFLWVHFFDAHYPYRPPEPYKSRSSKQPYYGEVGAMDEQFSRLLEAFERRARGPVVIVVVGDHGEGLGEHGELRHGHLLYQAVMRVPLIVVGPGFEPGVDERPVSTRHIFHTVLDAAGVESSEGSLRGKHDEIVLGEAMMPFLEYGWQPQVMAIEGRHKTILSGWPELYDVVADPAEARDLAATTSPSRPVRAALASYPLPSFDTPAATSALGVEERRKLASLGYVSTGKPQVVSKDAPRPVDKASLFEMLDKANVMRAMYRGGGK